MRKFVLVFAMVLVSAGAQAGQLRSLSLAGSESKTVQEPAKSVEPASAIETPRTPRTPKATEATEATGATEKQKFAERPPGVDVSRPGFIGKAPMADARDIGERKRRRSSG